MTAEVFKLADERKAQKRQLVCPEFPDDLIHYDDGTWVCMPESLRALQKTFKVFGVSFDPTWSFDTLYRRYGFLLRCAGLISVANEAWVEAEFPSPMVDYLRALSRNDSLTMHASVEAAMDSLSFKVGPPSLTLVRAAFPA